MEHQSKLSNDSLLRINSHETTDPYDQYRIRAQSCTNGAAQRLFAIIARKKSHLALAADVTSKKTLLRLADQVGPYLCVLKTHIDIIDDFDRDLLVQLKALSKKHDFLIFEDRKFADIGNTVKQQYEQGIYAIATWADLVTVHSVSGPGIIAGLAASVAQYGNGLVLLPSMSSAGNLMSPAYRDATMAMAQESKDLVAGLIMRDHYAGDPGFIRMMPGVQIQSSADSLGQQYISPEEAIERGADVIIVGRGICQAADPVEAARIYCERAQQAFHHRMKNLPCLSLLR